MLYSIAYNRWMDFVDYVPIASTVKSLVGIFSKQAYQQEPNLEQNKDSLISSKQKTSSARRLWSVIPVVGNIVVGGFDTYSYFNPSKILLNYSSMLSESSKNNRKFILEAVKENGMALRFASEELRDDPEIVKLAFKNDRGSLKFAGKNAVLNIVRQNGVELEYVSDEMKKDREIVLAAVKENGESFFYVGKELKNDREIVLAAVKENGYALDLVGKELKNDREIVLAAVEQQGCALYSVSDKLKNDREIVLAAVKQDDRAFQYASNELKKDRDFILAAVKQNGKSLLYLSDELKKDRDFILAAVKQNGKSLLYLSDELKNDVDFIIEIIEQNVGSFKFLTSSMKELLQTKGLTISFLSSQDTKTTPLELKYIQIAKALNQFSNLFDKSLFEALKTLEPNQIDSLLVSIENPKFLYDLLTQDQKVKVPEAISMKFLPLEVVYRILEESLAIEEIKGYNPDDLIKLLDNLDFSNPNALNYVDPKSIQELKKNPDVYCNKTFDEQKAKAFEGLKLMAGHLTAKDGFLGTPNAEKREELKAYYEYLNLRMGHIIDFFKNSKDSKEVVEMLFRLGAAGHACGERYKEEIELIYEQISGNLQNASIEGCIKQSLIDLKASFIERHLREVLNERGVEFDLTNPHILGDVNKIKELSGLVKNRSFSDPFTSLTDDQIADILAKIEKDYEAQAIIESLAEKIKRESSFLDLAIDFIKENIPEDFDPETNIWVQRSLIDFDENEELDRTAAYLSTFYTKAGVLRADFMAEELLTNPKLNFLQYLKK